MKKRLAGTEKTPPERAEGAPLRIDYEYLSRISKEASLYTSRKTSNLLDGSFSSLTRGKSLEFDDLQEYAPGDDIRDIDWKASSRADRLLIRRYEAQKKHNVLFVCDTGRKLGADTPAGESKAELALLTLGVTGYLLGRQGADLALTFGTRSGIQRTGFRFSPAYLDELLRLYGEHITETPPCSISELLRMALEQVRRRMILIVLTDLDGLAGMDEALFAYAAMQNDLLIFSMDDAFLTGPQVYDALSGAYVDRFFARSQALRREELALRRDVYTRVSAYAKRSRAGLTILQKGEEVPDAVLELFARRRELAQNAVFR